MTRTQQIKDLIENAKEPYHDAHGCRGTLISMLVVCEAAESLEEAQTVCDGFYKTGYSTEHMDAINTWAARKNALYAAVRTYQDGKE